MRPEKCQIWTYCIRGGMLIVEKTEWQARKEIWIPCPFNLANSPRNHEISSVMVRFMNGMHDDIRQTFSNFYKGMVRPYHGTMPRVMFSKNLFHFCIVSSKHISLKYMPIPCKSHENVLNSTSMVFHTVLMHLFMHRLFKFELCALMPRECK